MRELWEGSSPPHSGPEHSVLVSAPPEPAALEAAVAVEAVLVEEAQQQVQVSSPVVRPTILDR